MDLGTGTEIMIKTRYRAQLKKTASRSLCYVPLLVSAVAAVYIVNTTA